LATAVTPGMSTISATLNGITGSTMLTVSPATLRSIAVTPANPRVAVGGMEFFNATGTFSDRTTQNLTSQVSGASSAPSVATLAPTGMAMGMAPGSSTISARLNGVTGSTRLTVASPMPTPIPKVGSYTTQNLVSDGAVPAVHTDSHLVNPWGIVALPGSPFW